MREENGGGGLQTGNPSSPPPCPPLLPSPLSSCTQSYCFVHFPLLTSIPFSLPPSLCYFEALDCFPAIGWLTVCHRNQHFRTILRTFYPNTVPSWSSLKKWREGEGVCGGGTLNTIDCQRFDLSPAPSAIWPPHSFFHRNGNSFVWNCFSLQKMSWESNGEEIEDLTLIFFPWHSCQDFSVRGGETPSRSALMDKSGVIFLVLDSFMTVMKTLTYSPLLNK